MTEIDRRAQTLPKKAYLIYMWRTWGWEHVGTATNAKDRDRMVVNQDSIPGGGQVIWRLFKAEGVAKDRFGQILDPAAE